MLTNLIFYENDQIFPVLSVYSMTKVTLIVFFPYGSKEYLIHVILREKLRTYTDFSLEGKTEDYDDEGERKKNEVKYTNIFRAAMNPKLLYSHAIMRLTLVFPRIPS